MANLYGKLNVTSKCARERWRRLWFRAELRGVSVCSCGGKGAGRGHPLWSDEPFCDVPNRQYETKDHCQEARSQDPSLGRVERLVRLVVVCLCFVTHAVDAQY